MKKLMIVSACALALSMGGAYAQQTQPAPGASSMGNVGPGATGKTMHRAKHATKHMTGSKHASRHTTKHMTTAGRYKEGTTTGMGPGAAPRGSKSMSAAPSSSGNVGPGTNNNTGPQPGGR